MGCFHYIAGLGLACLILAWAVASWADLGFSKNTVVDLSPSLGRVCWVNQACARASWLSWRSQVSRRQEKPSLKIQQRAVRGERAHDVVVLQQLCCEQLVFMCLAVFISVCAVY